jgi:hypothetical protein
MEFTIAQSLLSLQPIQTSDDEDPKFNHDNKRGYFSQFGILWNLLTFKGRPKKQKKKQGTIFSLNNGETGSKNITLEREALLSTSSESFENYVATLAKSRPLSFTEEKQLKAQRR